MKKKILSISILAILVWILGTLSCEASVSSTDPTVNSGANVTITINSSVPVASFKTNVTNNGGLTFVSAKRAGAFDGGANNGTLINGTASSGESTTLATYTFKVPTVSKDTTYKVSFSVTGLTKENLSKLPDGTTTATVTVKAPAAPPPSGNTGGTTTPNTNNNGGNGTTTKPKSGDATLKSLSVEEGKFTESFSSNKTTYYVNIGKDVNKLTIHYQTTSDPTTARFIDNGNFTPGENTVKILVTAENGATKYYYIKAIKESGVNLNLTSLEIEGITLSPAFNPTTYEYTAELVEDKKELTVKAVPQVENITMQIIGGKDLKEGENVITVLLSNADGSVSQSYTIKVNKIATDPLAEETEENTIEDGVLPIAKTQEKKLTVTKIQDRIITIILITAITCIILSIIFYLIDKYQKQQKKENEELAGGSKEEIADEEEQIEKEEDINPLEEIYQKKQKEIQEKEEPKEKRDVKQGVTEEEIYIGEDRRNRSRDFDVKERRKYPRDGKGKHSI